MGMETRIARDDTRGHGGREPSRNEHRCEAVGKRSARADEDRRRGGRRLEGPSKLVAWFAGVWACHVAVLCVAFAVRKTVVSLGVVTTHPGQPPDGGRNHRTPAGGRGPAAPVNCVANKPPTNSCSTITHTVTVTPCHPKSVTPLVSLRWARAPLSAPRITIQCVHVFLYLGCVIPFHNRA